MDKVRIFEECSHGEKIVIKKYFRLISLKKEDRIFKQGDTGRTLYIVKKGIVGNFTECADGSEIDMARYSPGMVFGEMAMVDTQPRSTTSYALTDIELLVIDFINFYRFIWTHPAIGIKVLRAMMRYMILGLREADNFLVSMAMWGERARHRAITDGLTHLYNKRFFDESLEITILKSKQTKRTFSLLMFDIDDFHNVNQKLGRKTGDEILKAVAGCIKSVCLEDSIASRLGGDEFAVLLPDRSITDSLQIAKKIKRILKKIDVKSWSNEKKIDTPITASIGIAEFPDHGSSASLLKEAVDKALYRAKHSGKNKIMCVQL